jgi:uncharacterized DUF497 family protein
MLVIGGESMTPLAFDWDEGNSAHIARHDVTMDEAEQAITGQPVMVAFQDRGGEFRRLIVGRTQAGRVLSVAYIMRDGCIRVVTAHTAKEKHRRLLEEGGT